MYTTAEPVKMSRISNDVGGEAISTPKAFRGRSMLHRMLFSIVSALAFALTCGTASAGVAAFYRYDGTYRGSSSLVRGRGYVCGASDLSRSLVIAKGGFDYPFQIDPLKTRPVPVKISPNGSFTVQLEYGTGGEESDYIPGEVTITGHIIGPTLQATASDMNCSRDILLRRN
jgi:hypothetical protein